MKIIRVSSKKAVNKEGKEIEYSKYILNLPKKEVEESGLLGKDLQITMKDRSLVITSL